MTVWALRDFVKALNEANIPNNVRIECIHNYDTKGLTAISIRFNEEINGWENEMTEVEELEENLKNAPQEVQFGISDFLEDPNTGVVFNKEERSTKVTEVEEGKKMVEDDPHNLEKVAPAESVYDEAEVEDEEDEEDDRYENDDDEDEDDEDDEEDIEGL